MVFLFFVKDYYQNYINTDLGGYNWFYNYQLRVCETLLWNSHTIPWQKFIGRNYAPETYTANFKIIHKQSGVTEKEETEQFTVTSCSLITSKARDIADTQDIPEGITPSGGVTVREGEDQLFTIASNVGLWQLSNVEVDGNS